MCDARRSETGCWHALRVRPRQERILDRELNALSIRSFTPVVHEKRNYAGIEAAVLVPLIPGYVFVEGSVSEMQPALGTGRVIAFAPIDSRSPCAAELHALREAMSLPTASGPIDSRQMESGHHSATEVAAWRASCERIVSWLKSDLKDPGMAGSPASSWMPGR